MTTKIATLKDLISIRTSLRAEGKKVVFTNGCFDILHRGHVTYLQKARACGDVLIVGLNKDRSVRKIKGPTRPIVNEKDRAYVLSALACVDHVVLFGQDTPYSLIKALEPDVLVKGADWKLSEIVGKDVLDAYGGEIKRIRFVQGRSSTSIIDKIREAHD